MSPQTTSPSQAVMDPETLFESRTIDEIASFSRSLSQDIDRKREELRTMVGESYRDLMEAAETITHMRQSADMVIAAVDGVIGKGSEMHSKALVGFPSNVKVRVTSEGANEEYLAVAAEIKLLMMAPEKIWSAVDRGDFLLAVQIYLFARHIHTSLILLDTSSDLMSASLTSTLSSTRGEPTSAKIVSSYFPVVSRQWASIAHFYEAILEGCRNTLSEAREDEGGTEKAVRAMAAIVLLKGITAEELFKEFLSLRKAALAKQLKEDGQKETARVLIENSLKLIRMTVNVIFYGFVDKEKGSLVKLLQDPTAPTLSLFETRLSPVFKHLPSIIADFVPSIMHPVDRLEMSFLSSHMITWLDGAHEIVIQETSSVLSHVSSIPALATIRKNCYDCLLSTNSSITLEKWRHISKSVLDKELNLWDEFYREIFRDRTEALISSHIAGTVYYVQSSLSIQESDFDGEVDLTKILWSESNLNEVTSLPKFGELGFGGNNERAKGPSSLELKAQGYSAKVLEICGQFDSMLEKLLHDLTLFFRERHISSEQENEFSFLSSGTEPKEIEPFDLSADDEQILQFVQDNLISHIMSLVEYISVKHVEKTSNRGLMLLLGRFYQAVPELCSTLKKCVLAPQTLAKKQDITNLAAMQQRRAATAKVDPHWAAIQTKFEQESCRIFNMWITSLTNDLRAYLTESLVDEPIALLKSLPATDLIEISEEAEDGSKVKSKIKVPQHPSVAFTCALARYCNSVYNVAPYSLPSSIQLAASQEPAKIVCEVYGMLAERNSINQIVALQFLFDLHFVSQCMITRENKELTTTCQGVISRLESHIDPFDLSVFSPYMATNVKKSILREHGFFSLLIPTDRYTLLASMKSSLPSTASHQQEQHNVMWTYVHRPEKIPVIPIPRKKRETRKAVTDGANSLGIASSTSMSSISPVMGRKKRDKSPIAKATGSFFEAMSTGWFGGK